MSVPMKKFTLYLDKQQLEKLESLSKKTMAPVAAIIRKAIDTYLKKGESQ